MEGGAGERLLQLIVSLSSDVQSMMDSTAAPLVLSGDSIEVLRKSVGRRSPDTSYDTNVRDFFGQLNLTPILPNGDTSAHTSAAVMTSTPCLPPPNPHLVTGNKQKALCSYYKLGKRNHQQKTNKVPKCVTSSDTTARKQFRSLLRKAPSKVQSASRQLRNSNSSKVKVAKVTPISPPLCVLVQPCRETKEKVGRRFQFPRQDMDIEEDILTYVL